MANITFSKCRKRIIVILASVLAIVTIFFIFIYVYAYMPGLQIWEKRKVEKVYYEELLGSDEGLCKSQPLIWYDENGYVDEWGVWRYIGTYGRCYAFLWIGNDTNGLGQKLDAFPIEGLTREVYYPRYASIMLYHSQKEFTYEEVAGYLPPYYTADKTVRMRYLDAIENREDWLTDKQLEKLTRDVEKIAKEHN